ncbi:MAG: two-component system sensor histidine kinase NtrB [Syntrophales bacterium]|jgi:two-component system, NtrC family, sensor histidine kinase PilS
MSEQLLQEDGIDPRLRWLMLSRVAIVTFLLMVTTFIKFQKTEIFPEKAVASLYALCAITYFLSLAYVLLLKFVKKNRLNVYIQALTDVALITFLVYITGGISSIYSVFYPLAIIYSVLFLEKRGGLIIASASGILYGLLLDLEYYGIIHPINALAVHDYDMGAGYVFSRIFIHLLSFYIIGLLASFVVEQERRVRTLLAAKETAFDQLDLLHRSIIESVETGILTINLQGRIKSLNRAAEEISGLTFSDVVNRNIVDVFPGFAAVQAKIREDDDKLLSKNRYNIDFARDKNNKLILSCFVSALKDAKGKRIGDIVIFQDITSMIEMEEALEKSKRLAIIGEMAAGLAHEMRNPLASLSGSIQILKRDLQLSEVDEKLMQIILRGKDQLDRVIRDFLLLARPAPGDRETVFIRETIEGVIESIRYLPDWNDGIKVRLELSDNLSVYVNRTEIREVIWNLVINAVQSMPDGGELFVETRKISDGAQGESLEIRVSDTGCGIDDKNLDRIFEPFFTTRERGTGLGLAIVNRIIEGYTGRILIQKGIEKGTICTVALPLLEGST